MNSFLFLLFTLSLLVLTQIQTGVLGNTTASSGGTSGASIALGSMDGGSILFFLTHILIHLFYLS
uniref:CAMPATH-1 antigen n=1 Tax=Urocitellus parryii TaxID=9999 RepID=A0A8D2IF29_UROPR